MSSAKYTDLAVDDTDLVYASPQLLSISCRGMTKPPAVSLESYNPMGEDITLEEQA